jgi:hypothetical protein
MSARQASCSAAEAPAVTTMRRAGTSRPKRWRYQPLMASRSGSRPTACVYWVAPPRMARSAASCTSGGAVKSGSPMFRNTIGRSLRATSRASAAAALATSIT